MSSRRLSLAMLLAAIVVHAPVQAQEPSGAAGIAFDYQDVDIKLVISALAEAAGLNVIYGQLPDRPVTLRTNSPVTRDAIRPLLMSLLDANGLRAIEENGVLRVETIPPPEPERRRDSAASQGAAELFVYRLRHARALRLAATIQGLFGVGGATAEAPGLSRSGLTNALREQQVPPMQTGDPAPSTAVSRMSGQLTSSFMVHPDELTNSLLVRATAGDWEVIRQAIEALDLRPLQVMIEVIIAEVRRSSTLNLGVGLEVPPNYDPDSGITFEGELAGGSTGDLVLRLLNVGRLSADVVLSALASRGDVTIVSRPLILAQNNQEARIMVGSQRPFVQVFRALPTDNAVRDQVVQYRDVGTALTIRPTINHDGYVSLDLLQEVSTATNETQFGAPVISTREAATQLLVRDDQTVVIGGLVDRQQDRTRGGIPILKDIPLLGALFGSTQKSDIHTELFLFITPHIIETDDDADSIRSSVERAAELLKGRVKPIGPLLGDTIPRDTLRER